MRAHARQIALFGGPALAIAIIVFCDLVPGKPEVTMTAAVAVLMAVWWISEVLPLAVTSLLPVVLFPLLGVMNGKNVATQYFNHYIFLFLGGFIVALAMERWNLHRRIALRTLLLFGVRPRRILLGFMVATAFLSMWISNTATTMMMVPIVLAIVLQLEESLSREAVRRYAIAVLLGVAYGASIGGIATLVGTPPNLVFAGIFSETFGSNPGAPDISFADWMKLVLPISLVLLGVVWTLLSLLFLRGGTRLQIDPEVFRRQYRELGPITFEETVVLIDFILLALLWLTRAGAKIGPLTIPGWQDLLRQPEFVNDGVVAVAMAVVLFLIPARREKKTQIMNWETTTRLPWNIILLFGGGFALAEGFKVSGLSEWVGAQLDPLASLHPLLIILIICLLISFLTELTSNTATSQMILPVLAALAVNISVHPLLLMIPATLSCSCAFMLPVATPPNAIIFGTQRLRVATMAKTGVALNILAAVVITLMIYTWGRFVLDIDLNAFPDWAAGGAG